MLEPSATTVYPVKDGYRDSVKFHIRGMNGADSPLALTGDAILSKGNRIVKTWHIAANSDTTLNWDGRIKGKIVAGTYLLTVKAQDAKGDVKTTSTKVQVLGSHLVTKTAKVTSKVGAKATTAKMPAVVTKAAKYGKITVKVRTVAIVVGKAKLIFQGKGGKRVLVLKNGTHTSKAMPVPTGFKKVTIKHSWKPGTAKLKSVKAIWSYKTLVK